MSPTWSIARCGVLDVGQADLDLVGAEPRDLGLGDAELVDPLADDLDRAVDVLAVDFGFSALGSPW